jgi:hypothetical protein
MKELICIEREDPLQHPLIYIHTYIHIALFTTVTPNTPLLTNLFLGIKHFGGAFAPSGTPQVTAVMVCNNQV